LIFLQHKQILTILF